MAFGPPSARQGECRLSQAVLRPPDHEEVKKGIARLGKRSWKTWSKEMDKECAKVATSGYPNQRVTRRLREACSTKNPQALREAFLWLWEKVAARTCELRLSDSSTETFTQLDANRWQRVGVGTCATSTVTIYRKAPKSDWEYKVVRSITGEGCSFLNVEAVWAQPKESLRQVQCEYVSY